ncbi:hypothetical protein [Clostridium tagluense]|uniref:HNH nuclease domain-containing protein n=1 Tax=Clostridium tagluense TaxID=360422 RepID=A0A401ULE9_9CLOT|nr:hypothetical protein [Clostridium tagluense]GCD10339.1 hypothetical protein Ctaglu_19620 [Clostridium tagluense]
MIKIQVSERKLKDIKNKHWQWFKDNILKNWIAKMTRETDNEFLEIFFKDRDSFNKWSNNIKKGNIKIWIKEQEDIKFDVFKEFIIGNVNSLNELKNQLGIIRGTENNIKKYFENQYNKFRDFQNQWGGAYLIDELNINVCPYCNRNFIDTYVYDKKKKLVSNAQLDHFYAKEQYPYFAVSLYNLIPCCAVCNLGKLNDNKQIIYPYEECFGDFAKFETGFINDSEEKSYDISYLLGNSDNFKIELKPQDPNSDKGKKIQNSINTFHLEDLYNFHKDYVRELIKKAIIYNESRIDELYTQYPELFKSREEVVQMVVSNYISNKDLGKRPLAKLTKDICEELGLI